MAKKKQKRNEKVTKKSRNMSKHFRLHKTRKPSKILLFADLLRDITDGNDII